MSRFVQAIDEEITALERELEELPINVKLRELKRLRAIYTSGDSRARVVQVPLGVMSFAQGRPQRVWPAYGKSIEAVNGVIKILANAGAPLRTATLLERLGEIGVTFSGNAPQNTLASLLSRAPEVETRGGHIGWALSKWNSAGGDKPSSDAPPADDQPEAQGREAGPGGGT